MSSFNILLLYKNIQKITTEYYKYLENLNIGIGQRISTVFIRCLAISLGYFFCKL